MKNYNKKNEIIGKLILACFEYFVDKQKCFVLYANIVLLRQKIGIMEITEINIVQEIVSDTKQKPRQYHLSGNNPCVWAYVECFSRSGVF